VEDRKFICPCYRHEQDIAGMDHCLCHLFVSEDYAPPDIGSEAVLAEDSAWPGIVVYGAYWCQDTTRTRAFLNRHGVPYTLVDVEADAEAARQVMAWNQGYLSTPTLDIEGRIVTEPSDEELAELLGLT
jgi:glutaredoxin